MFSLGGILPSLFLNHISVKSWGLVVKWRHPLQLRGWIKWECVRDAQIRIRRNYPPKMVGHLFCIPIILAKPFPLCGHFNRRTQLWKMKGTGYNPSTNPVWLSKWNKDFGDRRVVGERDRYKSKIKWERFGMLDVRMRDKRVRKEREKERLLRVLVLLLWTKDRLVY
jgi:hypothetical protein